MENIVSTSDQKVYQMAKNQGYDDAHISELKSKYIPGKNSILKNLALKKQLVELENEDKRQDTQRHMVWFALFGMLLYPLFIMAADYFALDTAANLMSTIAPTYFISASLIVMVFFGAEGIIKVLADKMPSKKNNSNSDLFNNSDSCSGPDFKLNSDSEFK